MHGRLADVAEDRLAHMIISRNAQTQALFDKCAEYNKLLGSRRGDKLGCGFSSAVLKKLPVGLPMLTAVFDVR